MTSASVHVPTMTACRAALLVLVDLYHAAMLDPFISLLEIQKLAYFLKAGGEPMCPNFVKAPAGPCAEDLSQFLCAIGNYWTSSMSTVDGTPPQGQPALKPGAVQEAEAFLVNHLATRERINRVARLIEGYETSFGLELLATVHWVAIQEGAQEDENVLRSTYAWAPQKRQFSPLQIRLAAARLREEGWINFADNEPSTRLME